MFASINESLFVHHPEPYQTPNHIRLSMTGTLENTEELRHRLPQSREKNLAREDAQVLALFIDAMRQEYFSMYETLQGVCRTIRGNISFIVSDGMNHTLFAANMGQPLRIQRHRDSMVVTSDVELYAASCEEILVPEYGAVVLLNPDEVLLVASADGGSIPPYWIPFVHPPEDEVELTRAA